MGISNKMEERCCSLQKTTGGCSGDNQIKNAKNSITSLSGLASELEAAEKLDKDVVEELLRRYNGTDYQKHVKTDSEGRYHRGEVCTGTDRKFCVLVMTWNPNNGSAIHSHGNSECSLKMVEGDALEERVYKRVDGDMKEFSNGDVMTIDINRRTVGANECGGIGYVNDNIGPHAIWNLDPKQHAVSIHVYYPAYDMCWVFDDETGDGKICLVKACAEKCPDEKSAEVTNEGEETREGSTP